MVPKNWDAEPGYSVKQEQTKVKERHGSPTFYALLDEAAQTHDIKSHDYASNSNPYGNYHFAGQVAGLFSHCSEDAGFAGRIAEKLYRISNLEKAGKTAKNESIEDTEKDLVVLIGLWMADRRDRRARTDFKQQLSGDYASPDPCGGQAYLEDRMSMDKEKGPSPERNSPNLNALEMDSISVNIIKQANQLPWSRVQVLADYFQSLANNRLK